MRVVALISGGKDSCYAAMRCVAAGHTLVALANLQPEGKEDELDSFMWQTVGHEAVELVAQAMQLPLYRTTTSGRSKGRGLQYTQQEGDEVEDLFQLLQRVQRSEKVEGVSSGAVLSDYQRLRVEHVCGRLGLTSLALLWRREQRQLLEEMISAGVTAVLVKVASIGLKESHLGCNLQKMKPHLLKLHRQYGVHVCGEGGEYETITLDCPLFSHSIVIEESEVVEVTSDDLAPVAYLQLKKLRLQPKSPSWEKASQLPAPPPPPSHVQVSAYEPLTQVTAAGGGGRGGEGRVWRWAEFQGSGVDVSQQTSDILSQLSGWLEETGCQSQDVALTHLSLSSMEDFPLVNSLYQPFFPSSPPARVCVQLSLPPGVLVRLEVLLYQPDREEEERGLVAMHVQSVSSWAPANIGPYSQAVKGGEVVFLAGQIGLDPISMNLVPSSQQPSLSLHHVTSVLEANHTHLTSALYGICYYTTEKAGWAARMTWTQEVEKMSGCGPVVVFLRVPGLPRGACVEWTFTALTSSSSPLHRTVSSQLKQGVGLLSSEEVTWSDGGACAAGAWLFSLHPVSVMVSLNVAVKVCETELTERLSALGLSGTSLSQLRWFLPHYSDTPPVSPNKQFMSDCPPVTVTICEGYFGQNCCLSLLALLLPP